MTDQIQTSDKWSKYSEADEATAMHLEDLIRAQANIRTIRRIDALKAAIRESVEGHDHGVLVIERAGDDGTLEVSPLVPYGKVFIVNGDAGREALERATAMTPTAETQASDV